MKLTKTALLDLIRVKSKFFLASGIATGINLVVFEAIVAYMSNPLASGLAYISSSLINFLFQRFFIFKVRRNIWLIFAMSMGFSLLGAVLSSIFMLGLDQFSALDAYRLAKQIMVTGIVFFFNFYTKRFSFEKRLINTTTN